MLGEFISFESGSGKTPIGRSMEEIPGVKDAEIGARDKGTGRDGHDTRSSAAMAEGKAWMIRRISVPGGQSVRGGYRHHQGSKGCCKES